MLLYSDGGDERVIYVCRARREAEKEEQEEARLWSKLSERLAAETQQQREARLDRNC